MIPPSASSAWSRRTPGGPEQPTLSGPEFARLARLIEEHSWIHLTEGKRELLQNRLRRRLRALGLTTFGQYCQLVARPGDEGGELDQMLEAVSTNETSFFREPDHFEHLCGEVLPQWRHEVSVRVLSAGCATGQEAYSIAIRATERLGPAASSLVSVLGVDISRRAIHAASRGTYPLEEVRPLGLTRLKVSFQKGVGRSEGLARVAPRLRAMVEFRRVNLAGPVDGLGPFHAIFCRNVAIYFDHPAQDALFAKLIGILGPRGTLYVGHTESLVVSRQPLRYVAPGVYERLR